MLLRRITEHVKAQNWTAVALDFVIVVVGVFIGIQVSNWNDARGERNDEAKYLVSLEQDMTDSITEIDDVIRQLRSHDGARHTLFDLSVAEHQNIDPKDIPGLIHGALWSFASVELRLTTFDTLRSSGRLGVLADDELVSSLQDLAALIDEAEFEEGLELHALERITDPFLYENIDMAAVLKTPSVATGDVYVSWLGPEAASIDVSDFIDSQKFRNGLLFRSASTQERISTLQRIRETCVEIGARIDARQVALGVG